MLTNPNTLGIFNRYRKSWPWRTATTRRSTTTAPISTRSSASSVGATPTSTSCTSTFTRPSPRRTAAAVPAPVRWGSEALEVPADLAHSQAVGQHLRARLRSSQVHRLHRPLLRKFRRLPEGPRLDPPAGTPGPRRGQRKRGAQRQLRHGFAPRRLRGPVPGDVHARVRPEGDEQAAHGATRSTSPRR